MAEKIGRILLLVGLEFEACEGQDNLHRTPPAERNDHRLIWSSPRYEKSLTKQIDHLLVTPCLVKSQRRHGRTPCGVYASLLHARLALVTIGNAGTFAGRAMSHRAGAMSSRRLMGQSGMRT